MNTVVKQELSNKSIIDFSIGDKPHTVSCDYMDTCSFKCKPFKEITKDDIKVDTYNEEFIIANNDKIVQRIKDLLKERFFYKKEDLINEINVNKKYPLIQINYALNKFIYDVVYVCCSVRILYYTASSVYFLKNSLLSLSLLL